MLHCLQNKPNTVCVPCNHLGMCNKCARLVYRGGPQGRDEPRCPNCRAWMAGFYDTRDKVHDVAAPPEVETASQKDGVVQPNAIETRKRARSRCAPDVDEEITAESTDSITSD